MPRPMALIGITVQTMQILHNQLHKVDNNNETVDDKRNAQTHLKVVQRRSMLPVLQDTRNSHTGTSPEARSMI